MNVRPSPDLSPTQPVEAVRPDRASSQGARSGGSSPAAASGDRVELSAGARAAQARTSAPQSPEVETARVALRSESRMNPARLHELREQVRTGHYDTPETIERITGAVARDLGRAE